MSDPRFPLIDIVERIDRILQYTEEGRDSFLESPMQQDAVIRNLEVIGEAAKRVPDGTRRDMPDIQWQEVAGMRDILIHRYDSVDLEIVWEVITTNLPALRAQLQAWLAGDDDSDGTN